MNPLIRIWSSKDWAFFFAAIPALLCLVFLLPAGVKQYLILAPKAPTLLSLFASNYTHSELVHLLSNIGIYWLVLFVLFNIETDRTRFYTVSAASFLILPLVSSLYVVSTLPSLPLSKASLQ